MLLTLMLLAATLIQGLTLAAEAAAWLVGVLVLVLLLTATVLAAL